jgi:hypothetical protein
VIPRRSLANVAGNLGSFIGSTYTGGSFQYGLKVDGVARDLRIAGNQFILNSSQNPATEFGIYLSATVASDIDRVWVTNNVVQGAQNPVYLANNNPKGLFRQSNSWDLAQANDTGLAASITATTLMSVPDSTFTCSDYLLSYDMQTIAAAGAGTDAVGLNLTWNDGTAAHTVAVASLSLASVGSILQGSIPMRCVGGSTVQYAAVVSVVSTMAAGKYGLDLRLNSH